MLAAFRDPLQVIIVGCLAASACVAPGPGTDPPGIDSSIRDAGSNDKLMMPSADTDPPPGEIGDNRGGADADADSPSPPSTPTDGATQPATACPKRTDRQPAWQTLRGGRLLGANLEQPGQIHFSLFAPRASTVSVVGGFNGWNSSATPLAKDSEGIWAAAVSVASPIGQEYRFVVDGRSVADPYAAANDRNAGNSIVVDRGYGEWSDHAFRRPSRAELVIYEANVADFSGKAGTFSGFEARIAHLQRLGVTAVELMPIAETQTDGYGWGYDASLFFAPESSMASSSRGAQVRELKHLIDQLHKANIAVIVDVVYNHVSGQLGVNHFWGIDPQYYFDYDNDGDPENDKLSWGYKMASFRPLLRKLMFDNMKSFMDDYHIDGFRIDSTQNMDIGAVLEVIGALDDTGYCDRTFIVEEFSGPHNSEIRAFNQRRGGTLVSSWGTGYKNRVWEAVQRGSASRSDLTNVTAYSRGDGWNGSDEVINYFSSHDEGTLNARFGTSKDVVKVAATHLLTAPGLPMIWAGDEFLRVHYGNYGGAGTNQRPERNLIDWTLTETNADLVDYYAALVRLRRLHPSLHGVLTAAESASFSWVNNNTGSAIGYVRQGGPGDRRFVVLVNYEERAQVYQVPFPGQGTWYLMADGRSARPDEPGLQTRTVTGATTVISVPARSAHIYMSGLLP